MKQYLCNTDPGSLNFSCSIHPTKVQSAEIRRLRPEPFPSVTQVCLFKYLLYQSRNNNLFWGCNNHNSKATFKEAMSSVARVMEAHISAIWSEILSLGSLVIPRHVTTCLTIDNLHLLPTKKSSPRDPAFGEPLYQWLQHISLLNLVVLPSVKEKLILTVLNLLIQAICQKPSLHMVPYHLIFTGGCFSKHYSKSYICPQVNMCHPPLLNSVFKYRRLGNCRLIEQKYTGY